VNYPSIKKLTTGLNIDKPTAEMVRRIMRQYMPNRALRIANKRLDGSMGVEYMPTADEDVDYLEQLEGIEYLNFGDTYTTTLLFDYAKWRWRVCTVGDVVERDQRRFKQD